MESLNATAVSQDEAGTAQPLRVGVIKQTKAALPEVSVLNLMVYMARQFNIELYFFSTKDFNPADKTVHATLIDGNTQMERIIPLPKIIYNPFNWFKGEPGKEIKSLITKECYFVRQQLSMTKQKIFDKLIADGRFKKFLIESNPIKSFDEILRLLEKYNNDVIVKPSRGMQGNGVLRITFNGTEYVITDKECTIFLKSIDELRNYYNEKLTRTEQMLQPYFNSRTKDGLPFDIRLHAQRAAEGRFRIFPYPRIGKSPKSILSNLSAGGHTVPLQKFLKEEFGEDCRIVLDSLTKLGNNFPEHFQTLLPKKISSMGLDVGIQRNGNSYELKIFEVNVGGPGTSGLEIQAAFAYLKYIQYLGKSLAEGTSAK